MNIEILRNTLYKVCVMPGIGLSLLPQCAMLAATWLQGRQNWFPSRMPEGSESYILKPCMRLHGDVAASSLATASGGLSLLLRMQAYLDDFEKFCSKLGGATAEVMGDLLAFEVLHATHVDSASPWVPLMMRMETQRGRVQHHHITHCHVHRCRRTEER